MVERISEKKVDLNLEWKRVGIIDGDGGVDGKDELIWVGYEEDTNDVKYQTMSEL